MVHAVIEINAPSGALQGIKESLAMYCERFGDCKVISIKEVADGSKQQTERCKV